MRLRDVNKLKQPKDIFGDGSIIEFDTQTGYAALYLNVPPIIVEGKHCFPLVFLATGYTMFLDPNNINYKKLFDPTYPVIADIGYIGQMSVQDIEKNFNCPFYFDGNYKYHKGCGLFSKWLRLMLKCYDANYYKYNSVGGGEYGFTVNPRWHSFTNFAMDSRKLLHYKPKFIYAANNCADMNYMTDMEERATLNYTFIPAFREEEILRKYQNLMFPPKRNEYSSYFTMWNPEGTNQNMFNVRRLYDIYTNKVYYEGYNDTASSRMMENVIDAYMDKCTIDYLINPDPNELMHIYEEYSNDIATYNKECNEYLAEKRYAHEGQQMAMNTYYHKLRYGFLQNDKPQKEIFKLLNTASNRKDLILKILHDKFQLFNIGI